MRRSQEYKIDFSRGINLINFWGNSENYTLSNSQFSLTKAELPPGYVDEIVNFRPDDNGNLISREPMIVNNDGDFTAPTSGGGLNLFPLCGSEVYERFAFGVPDTEVMVLESGGANERFLRVTHNGAGLSHTRVLTSGGTLCAAYYNETWWFFEASANTGHSRTNAGVTTSRTYTGMFGGTGESLQECLVWRNRIFGFRWNNIKFSKTGDPTIWATPDGGGFQLPSKAPVHNMVVWRDTLYIIDFGGIIWSYDFAEDPETDGYLRQITQSGDLRYYQGLGGRLLVSNNQLFVNDMQNLYQLVNDQLISVGDPLHLDKIKVVSDVKAWDIGYGILLVVDQSGKTWYFVYHHNTGMWTQYRFRFHATIDDHIVRAVSNWGFSSTLFLDSISDPFHPTYPHELMTAQYVSDNINRDSYRDVTLFHPFYRFKSGPIFLGAQHVYKKFRYFIFDLFTMMKTPTTGTPNLTPYKTTVEFVPTNIPDKVLSTLQRGETLTQEASEPYRILAWQRARGVSFTWETEDTETTSTHHPSRLTIQGCRLSIDAAEQSRNAAPSEANVKNEAV